ncbi:hypothetical protein [Maledivibacter halophilus]|uniref:Uncharacterized protein n=1 Tax=Maledivibacter halophilus TaxID=36842 RepID=A0A1T5KXI5_9FIRM|nr:hypothetical protein [Maledivibacter halophilus]SKC68484.1 hypothetical protein SAMN02194393_02152 [Maledivibacter halophilus]SKC71630.1 hypothetical protein SAMN02194393_02500 [Maledivibacter halophilus]SKC80232.1 hypothetical protein SAMN02194393_03463 [Maledivibacter halophilus]
MAKKKKYKKMTQKEKNERAKIRKKLREEGAIPPTKPRLNRSKFAKETVEEFQKDFKAYSDIPHLFEAISWMLPMVESEVKPKVSPEQVGVLKALKLALEIKKFHQDLKDKGETKYKPMDMYEKIIAPIIKL